MVSKCANPSCGESLKYFRGGKLYLFESMPPSSGSGSAFGNGAEHCEYFWLCQRCAIKMTLALDRHGQPVLVTNGAQFDGEGIRISQNNRFAVKA